MWIFQQGKKKKIIIREKTSNKLHCIMSCLKSAVHERGVCFIIPKIKQQKWWVEINKKTGEKPKSVIITINQANKKMTTTTLLTKSQWKHYKIHSLKACLHIHISDILYDTFLNIQKKKKKIFRSYCTDISTVLPNSSRGGGTKQKKR